MNKNENIENKYDLVFSKIIEKERKSTKRLIVSTIIPLLSALVLLSLTIFFIIRSNKSKTDLQNQLINAEKNTEQVRQLAIELTEQNINNLIAAKKELLQIYEPEMYDNLKVQIIGKIARDNSLDLLAKKIGLSLSIDSTKSNINNKFSIYFGDSIYIRELQAVTYLLMSNNILIDTIIRDSHIDDKTIIVKQSKIYNSNILTVENVIELNKSDLWDVIIGSYKISSNAQRQRQIIINKLDSMTYHSEVKISFSETDKLYILTIGESLSKSKANKLLSFAKDELKIKDSYIQRAKQ